MSALLKFWFQAASQRCGDFARQFVVCCSAGEYDEAGQLEIARHDASALLAAGRKDDGGRCRETAA